MLAKTQLHELYHWLLLTRILDDRIVSLHQKGKILGPVYTSRGQEAVSVCTARALGPEDILAPMFRNLGAVLVKGFTAREILCQYMGRSSTPAGGRDAGLSLGDLERGVIAPVAILGTLVPVVAGIALAAKTQKKGIVALTYLGDGGTGTTDFHEGLNFAAVQRLPMVLVLESNGWAFSTPASLHSANTDFLARARAYGVQGYEVDGGDVLEVHKVARKAVDEARDGRGPVLVVANVSLTGPDPGYEDAWSLSREEAVGRSRDPIELFEKHMMGNALMTAAEQSELAASIHAEVEAATKYAEQNPFMPGSHVLGGVYHEA